jgi:hypothetical protein
MPSRRPKWSSSTTSPCGGNTVFASAADAINYAHGICDKLTNGASYAQVMGDVKNHVRPNDEYAANYLVSNAVNIFCPAQLWQLRNSAGGYVAPPA